VLARPIVVSLALCLPAAALADPPTADLSPLDPGAMGALMHTYVRGERMSVVPFAFSGAATVGAGLFLLRLDDAVARGAAWPLLGFGVVELAAGTAFFLRSYSQEAKLAELLAANPAEFARSEQAHLRRITSLFQPILLWLEAAIIVAGGALAIVGAVQGGGGMAGLGLGLAVQGLTFFLLDWAVLDRANAYSAALDRFHPA
jgi:hypothetical protein